MEAHIIHKLVAENDSLKAEVERLKKLLLSGGLSFDGLPEDEGDEEVATGEDDDDDDDLLDDEYLVDDDGEATGEQSDYYLGDSCEDISGLDDENNSVINIYPVFDEDGKCTEIVACTKMKRRRRRRKIARKPSAKNKRKKEQQKEKRKKRKVKRHRRKKPVITVRSDVGDLLPEEEELRQAQLNIQAKLKQRYNINIKLIEKETQIELLIEQVQNNKPDIENFYLVDLGRVVAQQERWLRGLPRVKPFYAIKSNPDLNISRCLAILGTGFDCASKTEIEEALSIGVLPEDIIFANPCKAKRQLLYAKSKGVRKMTFDNCNELQKIAELYPEAELVLRILADDSCSALPLGAKFGASYAETMKLLAVGKELGLNIIGVSFHVGSGCYDASAYCKAITLARDVFNMAEEMGFKFDLLDIGGGWPGTDDAPLLFEDIAKVVGPLIDELFPPEVRVISEPGRYYCTHCCTLAVSVISRREKYVGEDTSSSTERQVLYYLSDGLYGSFNNIVFDHAHVVPSIVDKKKQSGKDKDDQGNDEGSASNSDEENKPTLSSSKLFGPTCDSIDVVCDGVDLPDLEIGDWLYFVNMGAYTRAAASSFNGFLPPNCEYYIAI